MHIVTHNAVQGRVWKVSAKTESPVYKINLWSILVESGNNLNSKTSPVFLLLTIIDDYFARVLWTIQMTDFNYKLQLHTIDWNIIYFNNCHSFVFLFVLDFCCRETFSSYYIILDHIVWLQGLPPSAFVLTHCGLNLSTMLTNFNT